jgi:AraC-like DNA-binding protein
MLAPQTHVPATLPFQNRSNNPPQNHTYVDPEMVIAHLVERCVLAPGGRSVAYVQTILAAPPEALRVERIARRTYASRRTLVRHFRAEGLPAPIDWVALARAMCAHRTLVRGGPIRVAAAAAGYPDQFTMSNAFRRITGMRPTQLRGVSWTGLLDVWIARQRERGTLTGPPAPERAACPLCGELKAS